MLSHRPPSARRDLPPPSGHLHRRVPSRVNPGSAPIPANRTVVAPPAGAAPLLPTPSRNAPFNLARPGFGPHIPRGAFFAAQRSNGSTIGSPLRRGGSVAVSIPTPSETASSSGDGDEADESEPSSGVEHIQVPERPVPGAFLPPPPMADTRARPPGPRHPQGGSYSLSAPRFTLAHQPSCGSSRSTSSGTTETTAERWRIWANVADQRSKVHRLRQSLRKRRIDLQVRRRQTDGVDNEFLQILRPLLVSTISPSSLSTKTVQERFVKLQLAREEYYGAENAYGDLEAELDREEYLLHTLEVELHRFLDAERNEREDEKYDSSYGSSDAEEEEGEEGEEEEEEEEASVGSLKNDADHANNNTGKHNVQGNDTNHADSIVGAPNTLENGTEHVNDKAGKRDTHESDTGHLNNSTGKNEKVKQMRDYDYILLGIDGERAEDVHPLYQKLLNAAADRELAREHHTELHRRHGRILNDLEMDLHRERARSNRGNQLSDGDLLSLKSSLTEFPPTVKEFKRQFGIPIDQDDLEFLQDYNAEEETVRRVMEEADQEVVRLKALCKEKGAMRKNPPYEEEFTIHQGIDMASPLPEGNMALSPRPAPNLSHPIFSILLSNPMHVVEQKTPMAALKEVMQMPKDSPGAALRRINCMKELGISRLMQKPENKTDFVNQWLIHRLRTSPMEVELLFSISAVFLKIMNLRRWQEDVLSHWKTDDAACTLAPSLVGARTPRDELDVDDGSEVHVDSDLKPLQRARSDDESAHYENRRRGAKAENSGSTRSSPHGL